MSADILPGYQAETLALRSDWEGPAVATLVHWAASPRAGDIILYLHGYNDYVHCAELGPRFADAGWSFYGLDLRKHGRSLLDHQTPSLVRGLSDYYEEIGLALGRIRARENVRRIVLLGHSTGGLIASLFAGECGGIDGLALSSPFLAFRVSSSTEFLLNTWVRGLGRFRPSSVVARDPDPRYAWSLHRRYGRGGEWDYDEAWKRPGTLELRAGFIRAVLQAQRRVLQDLSIGVPTFALVSETAGGEGPGFDAEWLRSDTVLDPGRILRCARRLGPSVETVRIRGALHDPFLSTARVRDEAYAEVTGWLDRLA
ncbi:MAG: alpha/beta fold hydrolase [Myxococcota bacterium]|nr:alpha/beta fold hydrolase [Myxococcota bacterium]